MTHSPHKRDSSLSGRVSFSHNPFGPRRSTSVHSLHQSFHSINSTPTLKKLSAKLFNRKPSSSFSSISTGPITTATSLSPPTSERKLSVPDSNSPLSRTSNFPQLVTRQTNASGISNASSQSISAKPSGLKSKVRSASVIAISSRSAPSLASLPHIPNLSKSGPQKPFGMDDDPDGFHNIAQLATPSLKSQYISHLSASIIQTPVTPQTPLEKPEFQTEYARQLFGGNAGHRRYTSAEDEDEELAHPSSGSDLDAVRHSSKHRNCASRGSISSFGRTNVNNTSSTGASQDASSDHSQSPHLGANGSLPSHRSVSSASGVSHYPHPASSGSQTPAYNPVLDSRTAARSNSTFRSSVRKKVDGLKVGMKLMKPSRVPADEANCLASADDVSETWGNDCRNSASLDRATESLKTLPSISLRPKNTIHEAPHQAPYSVNKPPARSLAVRNSIHKHLSGSRGSSSPTPSNQLSQARGSTSNRSSRDHQESLVACENNAFHASNSKPNSATANSQMHPPGSLRLRPGRVPLQSLDLDSDPQDCDPAAVHVKHCHPVVGSAPQLHRSTSSSVLQIAEGFDSNKVSGERPNTVGPEPTLQGGYQGTVLTPQMGLQRRRSPIIHESSNDLRRQIAREVNGNGTFVSQRTYSDGRPPVAITPSSTRPLSVAMGSLNPSRNSIQRLHGTNESAIKPPSSQYAQPNHSYQQHQQQYLQPQNTLTDANSLQQHSNRHPYLSGHLPPAVQSDNGHQQNPITPAGPPSQRGLKYQTPNLNYRWSSSALSSTVQQRNRADCRAPPVPPSPARGDHDESDEDDEIVCEPQAPSRSAQLPANQRQFYVREDELPAHRNQHVPLNDEPDRPVRRQQLEPNRMEKNLIVVNDVEYIRQCVIGRGGSSKVFRAGLGDGSPKMVAIKVVGLKQSDNQTYLTFCNEIELLKRLRGNDRIINLIDSAMDDVRRKVWLVMELGETDLNQLLNRQMGKPISFRFIKHIWEQMLQAVQAVHGEDIIHTDLKPANFVLVQGSVKIIDFGIAKAIPADTTNISRETQIGTANYMSPEALMMQQYGDRQTVKMGRATDVWALGCILYQMVYGHTPFSKLDTSLKVHTIRDPRHVIDYPPSVTPVGVTSEGKQVFLHEHKVVVEREAIATMKGCLTYEKEKRPEIPELLKDAFLLGPSVGTAQTPTTAPETPAGKITIPSSMIDDIVHKAWDWYGRKTANGGRMSDNQKKKFITSLKDSIQSSQ